MSYTIIYDRRFIKTTSGYIPVVLEGCNNCATAILDSMGRNRWVRSKDWNPLTDKLVHCTAEELLAWAESMATIGSNEIFLWNNKWVTGKNIVAWIRNGIANAMSIEDYIKWNSGQKLFCELRTCCSTDKSRNWQEYEFIETTADLENWITRVKERGERFVASGGDKQNSYRIKIGFLGSKKLRTAPQTKTVCAVLVKRGNNYLEKYEKDRSLSFTKDPFAAVVFPSAKDASAAIGCRWKGLRFVNAANAKRSKPWAIRVSTPSNTKPQYLRQSTRRHAVYLTDNLTDAAFYFHRCEAISKVRSLYARTSYFREATFSLENRVTGEVISLDMAEICKHADKEQTGRSNT